LGATLNRLNRFEEAEIALSEGIGIGSSEVKVEASLRYERAVARAELKKYDGAIADVKRALELAPNSVKSRLLLARINVYRGAVEEARRDALELLRRVPDHAGALRLLDQIRS
jgi:tetratricopeptide (TPR) repeat protein